MFSDVQVKGACPIGTDIARMVFPSQLVISLEITELQIFGQIKATSACAHHVEENSVPSLSLSAL